MIFNKNTFEEEDVSDRPLNEIFKKCVEEDYILMVKNPLVEEGEKFEPEKRWNIFKAHTYGRHRNIYFGKFPTADPESFHENTKILISRLKGQMWIPWMRTQSLYNFFNMPWNRELFNLPENRNFKVDIYDKISLKKIGSLDCTRENKLNHTIGTLWSYFQSYYIIHIYDPLTDPVTYIFYFLNVKEIIENLTQKVTDKDSEWMSLYNFPPRRQNLDWFSWLDQNFISKRDLTISNLSSLMNAWNIFRMKSESEVIDFLTRTSNSLYRSLHINSLFPGLKYLLH